MSAVEQALNLTVEISAAIASLRVPYGVLAQLSSGDSIEVDAGESGPSIILLAAGKPVAIASVAKIDGRLVATITEIISNLDQEGYDPWQIRKCQAAKA